MKKTIFSVIAAIVILISIGFAFGQPKAAGLSVPLSGTTNASGQYTVNFTNPFITAPNVQANVIGGTPNQQVVITKSTTGFTVTVTQRSAVTLLGLEVLLAATTPVTGAKVDVLLTANE